MVNAEVALSVDALAEEDAEIIQTKRKIKAMDEECQLTLRRLALLSIILGICVYCMFACSNCLLGIMVVSACFCQSCPLLWLPFFCSITLYVVSHMPTLEQAFTITEDIYTFHEKYKRL